MNKEELNELNNAINHCDNVIKELRKKGNCEGCLKDHQKLKKWLIKYKNIINHKPYSFEDLKPNMWVYDTKPSIEEFSFFKIEKILREKDCGYLYQDKNKKVFIDNMTNHAREFEEGRYFPLTKAMEEFKNE